MEDVCDYEKERLLRIQENQKFLMSLGLEKKLDIPQAPKREWKKKSATEDEDFVPRRSTRGREPKNTKNTKNSSLSHSSVEIFEGDVYSEDDESDEEKNDEIDRKISKWKSRNPCPGRRIQGGRIYDSENGTTCHQCRQKTIEPKVQCTNILEGTHGKVICNVRLDDICLTNRYGQTIEAALASGEWKCPKCLGICNCSFCRARQAGFESVDAYLRNTSGDQRAPIKRTKKSKKRRSEADLLTDNIPDDAANNNNNNNNNDKESENETTTTTTTTTRRTRKETIATTRERRESTRNRKYVENESDNEGASNDENSIDEEKEDGGEDGGEDEGGEEGEMIEDEYEVEKILKMKKIRGKDEYLYLVKWKGYDEITWEPKSNLFCEDLLNEFLKTHVKQQKDGKHGVKVEPKAEILVKLEKEEELVVKSEIKEEVNQLSTAAKKKVKEEPKETPTKVKQEKGIKRERSGAVSQNAKKLKKEPTKGITEYFNKTK